MSQECRSDSSLEKMASHGGQKPCCRRRGGGGGALVEPAALAALLSSGGYGYDLRRIILEMSGNTLDVDVGGLYRTLRRMEEDGSVISRWSDESAGPRRREYELTEEGIQMAQQWIEVLRERERLDGLLASMVERGISDFERRREQKKEGNGNE